VKASADRHSVVTENTSRFQFSRVTPARGIVKKGINEESVGKEQDQHRKEADQVRGQVQTQKRIIEMPGGGRGPADGT
jgi:hypothetical protein